MKKKYLLSIVVFILITCKIIGDFFARLPDTQISKAQIKSDSFIEIKNNDVIQQKFRLNTNTLSSINFVLGDVLGNKNNALIINILDSEENIKFNMELKLEKIKKHEYNKIEINPIINEVRGENYILQLELKNKATDSLISMQICNIDNYKYGELIINNEPIKESDITFFLESKDSFIEQLYNIIEKLNNFKLLVLILIVFGISFFKLIKSIITIDN